MLRKAGLFGVHAALCVVAAAAVVVVVLVVVVVSLSVCSATPTGNKSSQTQTIL